MLVLCKLALLSKSAVGSHLLQNAGADSNEQQQAGCVGRHAQLHVAVTIKELGGRGQNSQPCRQQRLCSVSWGTEL